MADPSEARLTAESTCSLPRPYDEVAAYLRDEWTKATNLGQALVEVASPLIDQGDMLKEIASTNIAERGGQLDVVLGGDRFLRFSLTAKGDTQTILHTVYYTTSRVVRYMPGSGPMFRFTLERIERKIREWAAAQP